MSVGKLCSLLSQPTVCLRAHPNPPMLFTRSRRSLQTTAFVLWFATQKAIQRIDRRFQIWSRRFATSPVFPLDRHALWYYAFCLVSFAVLSTAGLHGSSIYVYRSIYRYTSAGQRPLLGEPRLARIDEWNYHTPNILNQIQRRDSFAADSSAFGPHKAALFGNVPTDHWSTWLRPQFWLFHWAPPVVAYAFYWQAKAFLLLTGTFTLLLLLTRSSLASIFGAVWYFFSAYTQWSYSWPSLLPELVGLLGWIVCLFAYLTVGRNPWWLAGAALLCTLGIVNFAFSAYPPHQIPLIIFGLLLGAWWIYTQRELILRKEARIARGLGLIGCGLSTAAILGLFLLNAAPGVNDIARTLYPGQRSISGGTISLAQLFSHFVDYWKSEKHFPAELGNICEGTGYLWLAPAALLISFGRGLTPRGRQLCLFLMVAFGILATWILLPIPAEAGRVLFLDKVPPHRCLATMGLINIAIVITALTSRRCPFTRSQSRAGRAFLPGFVAFILILGALAYMNRTYGHFFGDITIWAATGYVTFLVICMDQRWNRSLTIALLLPTIATTALINPVDRGFDLVLRSSFATTLRERPDLRDGRWLAFSPWVTLSGFVSACGIDLFNGLKIIPPLRDLERFDPTKKYASITNQSCYLVVQVQTDSEGVTFESPRPGIVIWNLNPLDPRLRELGIKHLVFDSQPPPLIRDELKTVFVDTSNNLYAYDLP